MNSDEHLIFEAYKKKLNENSIPRISLAPLIGSEKAVKYARGEDGRAGSPYVKYILNGQAKYITFYYDYEGNFQRGLLRDNSGNGMDLRNFRHEDLQTIADECKLSIDDLDKAIEDGSEKIKTIYSSSR